MTICPGYELAIVLFHVLHYTYVFFAGFQPVLRTNPSGNSEKRTNRGWAGKIPDQAEIFSE